MVKIRRARSSDLEDIMRLNEEFHAQLNHYSEAIPYDRHSMAYLQGFLLENGIVQVAEVDGKIAGVISCLINPIFFNQNHAAATAMVFYVDPSARGHNIGKRLIRQAAQVSKQKKIGFLVIAQNNSVKKTEAADLYQAEGFEPLETYFIKEL